MKALLRGESIRRYVYAGKSTFTLVNTANGNRLTFRVQRVKAKGGGEAPDVFFAKVLTGPENTTSYTFLGTVFDTKGQTTYYRSKKSRIGPDAPSARTIAWLVRCLENGGLLSTVEFWHSGQCGRCGRLLTDPDSVKFGIGPKCRDMFYQHLPLFGSP